MIRHWKANMVGVFYKKTWPSQKKTCIGAPGLEISLDFLRITYSSEHMKV